MANSSGQQQDSLAAVQGWQHIKADAVHYDFFYALRVLEAQRGHKPRIGQSIKAEQDLVQLTQDVSLGFAPGAVASAKEQHQQPTIANRFFGLLGVNGPLPVHLTEHAMHRKNHHRDPTFAAFLDIFNHRLTGLLYRAWSNSQPTASFDRMKEDQYSHYLGCLVGQRTGARQTVQSDQQFSHRLYFSGILANQSKSEAALAAVLNDMLDVPVHVQSFVGEWLNIPEENQLRLGDSMYPAQLGVNTSLGQQVWECQNQIRIQIGPLSSEKYQQLLPGTERLQQVKRLINSFTSQVLSCDLAFQVQRDQPQSLQLGSINQLGWTSWLGQRAAKAQQTDTIRIRL